MRHLRLAGFLGLVSMLAGSAFAMGCSAEANDEDASSSESEINGSLANVQACAVRNAYLDAELSDFEILPAGQLPFAYNPPAGVQPLYARLRVPAVGAIYFIEYTATHNVDGGDAGATASSVQAQFRTADGRLVVSSSTPSAASPTSATFYIAGTGQRLSCGSGSSSGGNDGGWSSSSSGGWAADGGAWAYDAGPSSSSGWSGSSSGGWYYDASADH